MEIITPIGKNKVILKDYITGRDDEDIQKPMTDLKLQIGIKDADGRTEINAGEVLRQQKNIKIEKVVISVDGKKENILNIVLDMHIQDYKFILEEINKIIEGDFTKPNSKKQEDGIS